MWTDRILLLNAVSMKANPEIIFIKTISNYAYGTFAKWAKS